MGFSEDPEILATQIAEMIRMAKRVEFMWEVGWKNFNRNTGIRVRGSSSSHHYYKERKEIPYLMEKYGDLYFDSGGRTRNFKRSELGD